MKNKQWGHAEPQVRRCKLCYRYDDRGNVEIVLDNTQAVVAQYLYDPFGNLLAQSGTLEQPFGFSTKRYDAETGLVYYGRRFYSPAMDRWTTRDSLGEKGGLNLYAFVGNNPVNWVDPYGLMTGAEVVVAACLANPGACAAAVTGISYGICRALGGCLTPVDEMAKIKPWERPREKPKPKTTSKDNDISKKPPKPLPSPRLPNNDQCEALKQIYEDYTQPWIIRAAAMTTALFAGCAWIN